MAIVLTLCDLFRAGNKTTSKFDQLKPGEVVIQNQKGVDWVIGRSGGASTQETPKGLRGTGWRLPRGTRYDNAMFYVWNDYSGHWAWEPAKDMPLADYVAALAALHPQFAIV